MKTCIYLAVPGLRTHRIFDLSCDMWNLGSLTRDQTQAPYIGSSESPTGPPQMSPLRLSLSVFFKKDLFICLFIYFAALGRHCCVGSLLYHCEGSSLQRLFSLQSRGLGHAGFRSCGTWAQSLWSTRLIDQQHVGSSRARDWTCVPHIVWWTLNHWTTKEAALSFDILPLVYIFHMFFLWLINKMTRKYLQHEYLKKYLYPEYIKNPYISSQPR